MQIIRLVVKMVIRIALGFFLIWGIIACWFLYYRADEDLAVSRVIHGIENSKSFNSISKQAAAALLNANRDFGPLENIESVKVRFMAYTYPRANIYLVTVRNGNLFNEMYETDSSNNLIFGKVEPLSKNLKPK